jgi:hypothetical protein
MLTLSESWLTTQTSLLDRAATATGSSPTGTRLTKTGVPEVRSKISRVPLGVLTAKSVVPSGDIARGRTWPLSNSTNGGPVDAAAARVIRNSLETQAARAAARASAARNRCDGFAGSAWRSQQGISKPNTELQWEASSNQEGKEEAMRKIDYARQAVPAPPPAPPIDPLRAACGSSPPVVRQGTGDFMRNQARISSKGQITVPRGIPQALGVRPGDELLFLQAGAVSLFLSDGRTEQA